MNAALGLAAAALLAGCAAPGQPPAAQNAMVQAGQLFCAVQTAGGGTVIVGLINAGVIAAVPSVAPAVIFATGASKVFVDAACAAAGGVAVVPPTNPAAAPQIAIAPPVV